MHKYEEWIEQHQDVKAWLNGRPDNTRRIFVRELYAFCKDQDISPEEWRNLDKFKARDMAWQFISTLTASKPAVAMTTLATLKSWYRNKNGETLPFDSAHGGKHYFHMTSKKAALEHIPSKKEAYQIIDAASSLRDKALLLFLFQSGVRVNVIEHLKLKHVIDELDKDIIALKVTPDLDFKLRSRDIPFYYTFVNGEGSETLKRYIALAHKKQNPDAFLFPTSTHKPIMQCFILRMLKNCVKKAGLDPSSVWTHSLRKAFRKIVRQAEMDDDSREQLMGHVLRGSRQSYFDSKDVETIQKEYERCNFGRETPKSEVSKLKEQLETEKSKSVLYEAKLSDMALKYDNMEKMLKALLEKKETAET